MTAPRRTSIRFAPLLDPRRAVVVTDDGHELPIQDDTHFPAAASLAILAHKQPSSLPTTPSDPKPFKRRPSPDKPRNKSKSLLFTPEEILTLGAINLFRSSSSSSDQDNLNDSSSSPGWRRTSSSSSNTDSHFPTNKKNPPLIRSQSVQDSTPPKKKRYSFTSFFSSAPGMSSLVDLKPKSDSKPFSRHPIATPTTPTRSSFLPNHPRHKGARMLNGRIYGAKQYNSISENPFANARDEEPEFVEWGYGGMGSVNGARSAGVVGNNSQSAVNWERLSGNNGWAVPGGGRGGAGARRKDPSRERRSGDSDKVIDGGEEDDQDDGSGLAWVRKRKKLREQKDKAQITDSATQTTIKAIDQDQKSPSQSHQDHVMKAVSMPMPPRSPSHHRRPPSRGNTDPLRPLPREPSRPSSREAPNTISPSTHEDTKKVSELPAGSESSSSSSTPSASESSASEDEDSSDGESDSSEEDQEEEEEDSEKKRKTAIGAGVEKVASSGVRQPKVK